METKFNFKSQICTSRVQSERLLSLGLKPETADMHWTKVRKASYPEYTWFLMPEPITKNQDWEQIPAWSLHRLLLLIPKEVNIEGYRFPARFSAVMRMAEADDMYEYIIGVLERVIKEGYFPKEYLV